MGTNKKLWEEPAGRAFQRGYQRRFHYLNAQQLSDLAKLLTMIRARRGHALVTGPGGTGKTTLLKRIIEECQADHVFLDHYLTASQSFDVLLEALLQQFAPGVEIPSSEESRVRVLHDALSMLQEKRRVLICIDEAQAASDEVLLGLFQVANGDGRDGTVRVPLVLAGTDNVAERLSSILGCPLQEVVQMVFPLSPLGKDEVVVHIRHQLNTAGVEDENFFSAEAIERITKLSGGVQSEVSSLCGLAMHLTELDESNHVSLDIVNQVSRDCWITPIDRMEAESGTTEAVACEVVPHGEGEGTASIGVPDHRLRRRWGWMAMAAMLVTGSLSYVLLSAPTGDLPRKFATLAESVERLWPEKWPIDRVWPSLGSEPVDPGSDEITGIWNPGTVKVQSDEGPGTGLAMSKVVVLPEQATTRFDGFGPLRTTEIPDDKFAAAGEPIRDDRVPTGPDVPTSNDFNRNADLASILPPTGAGKRVAHQSLESSQVVPSYVPFSGHVARLSWEQINQKDGFGSMPLQILDQSQLISRLAGPATVRTRPSTQAPTLETLLQGEHLTVTGRIDGSNWYQIVDPYGELGYLYANLVSVEGPGSGSRVLRGDSDLELRLIPLDEGEASIREIPTLLTRARKHLEADRLLAPRFDNALYIYREVLRIDPDNADAQQGVNDIKAKLIGHSQSARTRGDPGAARRALEKVLIIDITDQQARDLLDQLK